MKKKKRKKLDAVLIQHQHVDKRGITFGAKHPLMCSHKKPKTQEAHDRTEG